MGKQKAQSLAREERLTWGELLHVGDLLGVSKGVISGIAFRNQIKPKHNLAAQVRLLGVDSLLPPDV